MRNKINTALKEAVKSKAKHRTSTLRLINAAIKDRDIAARTTGQEGVSDTEIVEILAKMIKQRRESVVTYEAAGRLELAQREQEEINIISDFLPPQLSGGQIEEAVRTTVSKVGAEGLRDIGKAMAALKEQYAGQMDFAKASKLVKQVLTN